MLIIKSISHLLESRREKGYTASLRKIIAHTHIRGNDLADAAAKLAVTDYDTLPHEHTLRVDVGVMVPRPPFWVMYTSKPPTLSPALATGPRQATLRPPWWTIPEEDRFQMHALARPSQHLRHKFRAATLRSMQQTSLYTRLVLHAKTQGAHTTTTGASLHTRLRDTPKKGTILLNFITGSYTMAN